MKLILKQQVKLATDRTLARGEIVDRKSLPLSDEQVKSLIENAAAEEYRPDRQADKDPEIEVLRKALATMEAELAETRAENEALRLQLPTPPNPLADDTGKGSDPKGDDKGKGGAGK